MKQDSIRSKLMRSYLQLLLVVVATLMVCFWVVLGINMEAQTIETLRGAALTVDTRLESTVKSISGGADAALLSLNQIDKVLFSGSTAGEELKRYNQITLNLYLLKQIFKELDSAVFVGRDGNVYSNDADIERRFTRQFDRSRNQVLEENNGMTVCFGLCREDGISREPGSPVLLVGKLTRLITTGEQLGYLYFAVQESSLSGLYAGEQVTPKAELLICGADGQVLSSSVPARLGSYVEERPVYGQTEMSWVDGICWVSYRMEMESISADLICRAPFHELYASLIQVSLVVLLAGLVSLGVAAWLSRRLSNRLVDPIERLSRSTGRIMEGCLDERCAVVSNDETGVLARNFNAMLDRLGELIELVRREQHEKAEKDMKLLQNRIRPHFLYNTLNTIFTLCAMERAEEAGKAAKMTADYYRLILSDGSDIVPVRDELKNTACFLEISKMWLGDRFRYEIICEPGLEDYLIPKMTLQPIAENAVQHALAQRSDGVLRITVERRGGEVTVRVSDNGAGIGQAQRKALQRGDGEGYGLKNVRERLALYQGEAVSFRIESEAGTGTTVEIRFGAEAPRREREAEDDRSPHCG